MAHFVQITDGLVTNSIVIHNDVVGEYFPASEIIGQDFIRDHQYEGVWLQTSRNNNFRKQYAGIGYTYDAVKDQFVAPQPYASWSLDSNNDWQAPAPRPTDGKHYAWDEESLAWVVSPAL